ncbi:BTB and MATH domain-containing protein 38 [Aphelenchoides avenae]|nr:BTB and MATH domain-containing protein 38 [Aphelenchus avenae]
MFFGGFAEASKDEIELEETPLDAWHDFYSVVYANCAVVNGFNVMLLIPMADRFRVEWLLSFCERYIISARDMNVEQKLEAAEKLPSDRALQQLLDGLTEADLKYLKDASKLESLSKETVVKLFVRA